MIDAPTFVPCDRVPGEQISLDAGAVGGRDAEIPAERRRLEILGIGVAHADLLRRDIDEPRAGIEGHRLPVVSAERTRQQLDAFTRFVVAALGFFDRSTAGCIDAAGPGDRGERVCRDQMTGLPIEHVKETVLVRLDQHLARLTGDGEIGQHELLIRVVVPFLTRCSLIVPGVGPGIRVDRDDRGQEQIVALAGTAIRLVPLGTVADAEVDKIERGIVGNRVPDRAAAAELPPIPEPGFCRHRKRGCLERLRWISGHGVEPPIKGAGFCIVGGQIAAHSEFVTAVADQHPALDHTRCHGDRVRLGRVDRQNAPHGLARGGIEGDQTPVERAQVEFTAPRGDTAVDHIATTAHTERTGHLRVVGPERPTGLRIEGSHHAPCG